MKLDSILLLLLVALKLSGYGATDLTADLTLGFEVINPIALSAQIDIINIKKIKN